MILKQFSAFVAKNRPDLDIKSVATGETWFGEAALERGLCDEIRPVDDVLLRYVDEGYQVYEIAYKPPPEVPQGLGSLLPIGFSSSQNGNNSIGRRLIRWLVPALMEEFQQTMYDKGNTERAQRYIAKDETAERIKIEERM